MVTATAQRRDCELFLLDRSHRRPAKFAALRPQLVSSVADLRKCVERAPRDSLWLSYASDLTSALVKNVSGKQPAYEFGLFVHALNARSIPALSAVFRRIAFSPDGGFMRAAELAEVLEAKHRADLFIGGFADRATETITFWRGNLQSLTVPFTAFEKAGEGVAPDFGRLSVIDSGQTVRLGEYEAAVDAILYEYDVEYRRRLASKRRQEDQSFGAALRRVRKQRGLRREDFEPDLSAKSIARLEQGKIERPRRKTLAALAKRLAVRPEEIATF